MIKLPEAATDQLHRDLVALLNSSTGCFWMKQTFHNKGGGGIGGGLATEEWEQFYEFDCTKITGFPLPATTPSQLATLAHEAAEAIDGLSLERLTSTAAPSSSAIERIRNCLQDSRSRMISLQEELDWQCYRLYGLVHDDLTMPLGSAPPIDLGERAFEIVMAKKMAAGELETAWFDRHHSTPITETPGHWPQGYRNLVERRIQLIESDQSIALIEQPEHKRRWNFEPWEEQERRAHRNWLLDRMESSRYWSTLELTSCARLADCLRADREFRQVSELYRGRTDFDWTTLVVELVETESVPFLSVLRHTDSGLRKRAVWERTWQLQRAEDQIDDEVQADSSIPETLKAEVSKRRKAEVIGEIPAPPKYESKDFRKSSYWALRGKLDVPKERFVSFQHCERDVDPTPVIAWAGWDHLQLAQAIAAYYERVKNREGWTSERRLPLLTGIVELLPWLKQWHNDIHPEFQEHMGDFFEQFVDDEARAMEMTVEQVRSWTPPVQAGRGRRRRNS